MNRLPQTTEQYIDSTYPKVKDNDVLNDSESVAFTLLDDEPPNYAVRINSSSTTLLNDQSSVSIPILQAISNVSVVSNGIVDYQHPIIEPTSFTTATSYNYILPSFASFFSTLATGENTSSAVLADVAVKCQQIAENKIEIDKYGEMHYRLSPNNSDIIRDFCDTLSDSITQLVNHPVTDELAESLQTLAYNLLFTPTFEQDNVAMGYTFQTQPVTVGNKTYPFGVGDLYNWIRTINVWTFLQPTNSQEDVLSRIKFIAAIGAFTFGKRNWFSKDGFISQDQHNQAIIPNDQLMIPMTDDNTVFQSNSCDTLQSCIFSMFLIAYYNSIVSSFNPIDDVVPDQDGDDLEWDNSDVETPQTMVQFSQTSNQTDNTPFYSV